MPYALRSGALLSIDLIAVANRGFALADLIQLDNPAGCDRELMSAREEWFRRAGDTAIGAPPRVGQTPNTFSAWIEPRAARGGADEPVPTAEDATDALVASYADAFTRKAREAAMIDLRDRHAACLRDQRRLAPSRRS